jgi:protein-disulfide isomerase
MKKNVEIAGIFLSLVISILSGSSFAQPNDIDWTVVSQINLDSRPLDVLSTSDGELVFVLMPGKVAVYDKSANRQLNQIPVDQGFDRLSYATDTETLILTNSSTNTLKVIHIDPVYHISVEGSPFMGLENAPVTLAVFDDYECGYCARMEAVFSQLLAKYPKDVKLVVKQFPLRNHPNAKQAAIAVLAAHKQGKFWEFHSQLFANQRELSTTKLDEIAESFDLDMTQFKKDLLSHDVLSMIVRDVREGQKIGVSGTPTIFLNGKRVKDRSFAAISELIERELLK